MAVQTILAQLVPATGTQIIEIAPIAEHDSKITWLRCAVDIRSGNFVSLPESELGESRSERSMKFIENERNSDRKMLLLLLGNATNWYKLGEVSLINRGMPYYPSLLRGLMDLDGKLELQAGFRLGCQIKDVGYGLLAGSDQVLITGTRILERDELSAPIVINLSLPEMNPTINVPITNNPVINATIPVEPVAIPIELTVNYSASPSPTPASADWLSPSGFSASSNVNNADANKAIDGDINSFWNSNAYQHPDHYWLLDLGIGRSISKIEITENSGDIGLGNIQHSSDGVNFTTINSGVAFKGLFEFAPITARFIKLQSTQNAGAFWRLSNVRVYGV